MYLLESYRNARVSAHRTVMKSCKDSLLEMGIIAEPDTTLVADNPLINFKWWSSRRVKRQL
jgi:hypothetical protein